MSRDRGVRAFWSALARSRRSRPAPALTAPEAPTALDISMMDLALAHARSAAAQGEVPIGAVVYASPGTRNEGEILGEAFNQREAQRDPSAHAEFTAIIAAARRRGDWRLNDCSLAVTLEPCPMCAGLIINARVGRIIYGAADPKAGAVRSLYRLLSDRRLNHRPAVIAGVREHECSALLTEFFRSLRRSPRQTGTSIDPPPHPPDGQAQDRPHA